ncbi:MAG: DNA primase [Gammaproteobacteria bacterium]
MTNRIPQEFINELIQRTDIVEYIDNRVALRKAGANYKARCPFHTEKSPSFTVSPQKQIYHCFGCGASGNIIGFMMAYERMDFIHAVESLAAQHGLTIPTSKQTHTQSAAPTYYDLLKQAQQFYRKQLGKHIHAQTAIDYLKKRGLTSAICQRYGVGFAPSGWRNLLDHFGNQHTQELLQCGLLSKNEEGRVYDRFRHRIMFPIRNQRGQIIGFGGRVINDNDQPKYLNSPETPIFHKGNELYGLYEAKQQAAINQLLVVEGYMDVISLAQFGIHYAVATLGTSITDKHMQRLFRHTDKIIFCFDGDNAGRKAAWRALETALGHMQEGRQINFLFLPNQDDPDTLIRREGVDYFQQQLTQAISGADFLLQQLTQDLDLSSLENRARLLKMAQPLLQKIPENYYRELLVRQISDLVRIEPERILQASPSESLNSVQPPTQRTPMRLAISLLLQYPQLAYNDPNTIKNYAWLAHSSLNGAQLLYQLLTYIKQDPTLNTATLLERWREKSDYKAIAKLAHWEHHIPAEGIEAEFNDIWRKLLRHDRENQTEQLLAKAKLQVLSPQEKDKLRELIWQNSQETL